MTTRGWERAYTVVRRSPSCGGSTVHNRLGRGARRETAEVELGEPDDFLRLHVSDDEGGQVGWCVEPIEEVTGRRTGQVLEIRVPSDDLPAIGMGFVGDGQKVFQEVSSRLALDPHTPFFDDDVPLLVELAQDWVEETVGLQREPELQFVRRQAVEVSGGVRGGTGIEAHRARLLQDLAEVVVDDVLIGFFLCLLQRFLELLESLWVGLLPLAAFFVERRDDVVDPVQRRLFRGVVGGSDFLRSLKAMCSNMWAMPLWPVSSSTEPTSAYRWKETTGTPCLSTMKNLIPLSSVCSVTVFSNSSRDCALETVDGVNIARATRIAGIAGGTMALTFMTVNHLPFMVERPFPLPVEATADRLFAW